MGMFAPEEKEVIKDGNRETVIRLCIVDSFPQVKAVFHATTWDIVARQHYDKGGKKIELSQDIVRIVSLAAPMCSCFG
jgi:hypothetical protein